MLIRRLEVRNWRGFTQALSVDLDPGLNVIVGPNESGKSSLAEALRFAFLRRADTTSQEVRSTVPKGRQLRPFVAVEFEVDGVAYRVEKTFMASHGHTLLSRLEGSQWRPLAEDKEAEALLGNLLDQDGLAHYAQALWAEQGQVLKILESGIPGDLKTRLAQLVTGLLLTDEDREVRQWVRSEWEQRFTKQWRKPKKNSPLDRALSDLARVADELSTAEADWTTHEQRLQQLQQATNELADLVARQQRQQAQLEEARKAKAQWDAYHLLAAEAQAAATRAKSLVALRKRWADLIQELEDLESSIAKARAEVARTEKELQAALDGQQRAQQAVKTLEERHAQLAMQRRLVRLLQARSLSRYLQHLRDSEPVAPSAEEMDQLRKQVEELKTLQTRLESLALRVRLQPSVPVAVSVSLDEQATDRLDAEPGRVYEWTATQSARLDLDKVASFTVETGMEDAAVLQRRIDEIQRTLGDELARWLTPEAYEQAAPAAQVTQPEAATASHLESWWAVLEARFAEAERIRADYNRTDAVYQATYPDLPRDRIEAELQALLQEHSWVEEVMKAEKWAYKNDQDLRALQGRLEEQQAATQQHLDEARAEERKKAEEVATKWTNYEKAKNDLDHALKERRKRLDGLRAIKDEVREREPDLAVYTAPEWDEQEPFDAGKERNSELFKKLTEAAQEASKSSAKLAKQANEHKPAGEAVSEEAIRSLEAALAKTTEKVETKKTERDMLQGQLKEAADGLADRLRSAQERYEDQLRTVQELALDARAWDLLEFTLQQEYVALTSSVLEPVQNRIEPLLHRLTGGRYRAVSVSDATLTPTALRGAHGEFEVRARELSYGTEEQLAFVTRLALGDLLVSHGASAGDEGHSSGAPDGPAVRRGTRQVLVMDDPLVNTDPARLDVAWQILLEAAQRLQLIILTCHDVPAEVEGRARLIRLEGQS